MDDNLCELCGRDGLIFTVVISLDTDEDDCVRNSAEICAGCLFLYDNNIELMVAVNEKRIRLEEEKDRDMVDDC